LFSAFKDGRLRPPQMDYRHLDIPSLMGFEALATRP
jgi:hypothetical protein